MRVCIFAESRDLATARELLSDLPPDAYGQVFIAGDGSTQLEGPARIQVNWLRTDADQPVLAEAMAAWLAEWLPDGIPPLVLGPTVWVLPGATATLAASEHDSVTRLITSVPGDQLIHG